MVTPRKANPWMSRYGKAMREYFRVGGAYYSAPGFTFDELRRWLNEYGELPDLTGMPEVKRLKAPPAHLSRAEVEDLTPRQSGKAVA
jgi:hypothetical protein